MAGLVLRRCEATLQIWVYLICVISPSFRPTQTGLCKFGWVWSSLILCFFDRRQRRHCYWDTIDPRKICFSEVSFRITEKGVEFKGSSLHDGFGGFDGFGGSGKHLALFLLVLRNTVPSDSRGGFDGFGGFGGHGGFSHDGYPP